MGVVKGLFWTKQRRRYLQTHLTTKQNTKKRGESFLPTAVTPKPINQTQTLEYTSTQKHTYSHTHKSISKRNFTHKRTSSNTEAPSNGRSGRSIAFQEASNTQVEPLRLSPSYSALSLTTQEEPCWAAGQEPKTGK